VGEKYITNASYCTARQLLKPSGRQERATLEVCLGVEPLASREADNLGAALADVQRSFSDEFGIDIVFTEIVTLPPFGPGLGGGFDSGRAHALLRALQTRKADAYLVCLRGDSRHGTDGSDGAGRTAVRNNISIVDRAGRQPGLLSKVIQHELGHLYYLEHEDDADCIMHPTILSASQGWCGHAKEQVLKYKHRLW
jgi:hypothetical protein